MKPSRSLAFVRHLLTAALVFFFFFGLTVSARAESQHAKSVPLVPGCLSKQWASSQAFSHRWPWNFREIGHMCWIPKNSRSSTSPNPTN
ncbi:MAG: hypothetical protein RIT19_2819 [Verrucomicrobiota bacterium]|jgi:hypothetical protein